MAWGVALGQTRNEIYGSRVKIQVYVQEGVREVKAPPRESVPRKGEFESLGGRIRMVGRAGRKKCGCAWYRNRWLVYHRIRECRFELPANLRFDGDRDIVCLFCQLADSAGWNQR